MSDASRQFEMEMEIGAPRQRVWDAIASAEGLVQWFPQTAEFTPGVGGEVVWSWGDAYRWPMTIETWEPGRRLSTRYDSQVDDGKGGKRPLFIDFVLDGAGGTTTLRLVHSGFGPEADFDREYDGISTGWPAELRSLRLVMERHADTARRLVWTRVAVPLPAEETWRRLTGPDGFGCGGGLGGLPEGREFSLARPGGGAFEGTALAGTDMTFAGVVTNLDDAFMRVAVECCLRDEGGEVDVWLWLALYDVSDEQAAAARRDLDAVVERAFAGIAMRGLDSDGEAAA